MRKSTHRLLDQPSGNLKPATGEGVLGFRLGRHAELRITHNPGLAGRYRKNPAAGIA
jgi:hypothetical protein